MKFAHLPRGVSICAGEELSYLIYPSGSGWWLDVYISAYGPSRVPDWEAIRRSGPVDFAVTRSRELAFAVAQAYESLAGREMNVRMDEALAIAGCSA